MQLKNELSPFPSQYVNYVYFHVDPITNEIVYIGHGTNERAWRCTSSPSCDDKNYGHRSKEHATWCQNLIIEGFTPNDWVFIESILMDKSSACLREQKLIRKHLPRFNKPSGAKIMLVTPGIVQYAKERREQGISYKDIANECGLATMTIHRALAGKTKNLESMHD